MRLGSGAPAAQQVAAVDHLDERHEGGLAILDDGVNDAPALGDASVGIAMGGIGLPAAIETADVALMADDLAVVPYAVRIARLLVRLNIALALGLKILLAVGAIADVVSVLVAVAFLADAVTWRSVWPRSGSPSGRCGLAMKPPTPGLIRAEMLAALLIKRAARVRPRRRRGAATDSRGPGSPPA